MRPADRYPYPDDPVLANAAEALEETGHWAWVLDADWRLVFVTDATRWSYGGGVARADLPVGLPFFGPEGIATARTWRFGPNSSEHMGRFLAPLAGWMLADTPGGPAALKEVVDPSLHAVIDAARPASDGASWCVMGSAGLGRDIEVSTFALRLRREDGTLAGTVVVSKPAADMAVHATHVAMADPAHVQLMQRLGKAERRPAAVLFADLESSSALARAMSTSSYFALGRRLVGAADSAVIAQGGLVGRHVGDGVVAYFLAEVAGSESAAARACIAAARSLREELPRVASASGLGERELSVRFGLHWGSTLYIGAVTTGGRSEVTALGDEVNEAARIEACASGGRILASKDLAERLAPEDAAAVGIDVDGLAYTALRDLDTATEKARHDAPAIPVCDL